MKTNLFPRWLLCLVAFTLVTAGLAAQDLNGVRQRMTQRLPELDRLRADGVVGENNVGLVEIRTSGSANAEAAVSAENADRQVVYAAIAQKTGATAESVGRARARSIASASAAGVWLQDESGKWYKK